MSLRPHSPTSILRSSPRRGFALLITITLLSFLVLLLVSLASLTRVETQVANNNQSLAQARQNALFALNVALGQLQNFFLPTLKLEAKERDAQGRLQRRYGAARTPWARVLAQETVSAEKKHELQQQKAALNPFALQRDVEHQLKRIFKERTRTGRRG